MYCVKLGMAICDQHVKIYRIGYVNAQNVIALLNMTAWLRKNRPMATNEHAIKAWLVKIDEISSPNQCSRMPATDRVRHTARQMQGLPNGVHNNSGKEQSPKEPQ